MKVKTYYQATSLQDAYDVLVSDSKNAIIGGGLWMKKSNSKVNCLIDLSNVGLDKIEEDGEYIKVGSMVTQRQFEQSELIKSIAQGVLNDAVSQIMSATFRNMATIGGSLVGRYPFSDLITPLLLIKTVLVFFPHREVKLQEYLEEKTRQPEVLSHILIKRCAPKSYFKKVKMTALDFPILNIGVSKCSHKDKYKIVVGSRPAVACKAKEAMEFLNAIENPTCEDFAKAGEIAVESMKFLTNMDATEEYRKILAKTYIKRGLMEVSK